MILTAWAAMTIAARCLPGICLRQLGFYPVCPGTDQYVLGAPYLPYIRMNLPNGRTFEIKAPKVSDRNCYVRQVKLNGKVYD